MKCHALNCENQIPHSTEAVLCKSCTVEMDRLLRVEMEMAKQLGRPPTDGEVDEMFDRVVARRAN